ncbi:MAG: tRNA (adenosine(37)-N6)-threonylcarbamoyltransferase complex dimerization subunit type 1 TsaB [bacterium]|nr:MAG: tRNA (adenosine(37)-N6)-threonylcarbamoyltransferase complex dimerization subunit type 1 TsaB [bacterium]
MPLILALDTSHMKGSVAVARGDELLCEILFDASDTHSATLMPAVDACLYTAGVGLAEIDRFAIVSGPGSFTGLRIGLATVKAFAAVGRRPVVPVPSVMVLASAFPFCGIPVLPLIDARRGEVYGGLYATPNGFPEEILAPFSAKPASVGKVIADAGVTGPVVACGTGLERYREQLSSVLDRVSRFAHSRWSIPSASLLAVLSLRLEPVPYDRLPALEPLYIRPPDARLPADTKLGEGGGK